MSGKLKDCPFCPYILANWGIKRQKRHHSQHIRMQMPRDLSKVLYPLFDRPALLHNGRKPRA